MCEVIKKIMDKEYLIEMGRDFDSLSYELCGDRMLDKDESEGGKPVEGLVYELDEDGHLIYYSYYKHGFEDGECVSFYTNGNVESIAIMKRGRIDGKCLEYFENGNLKSETFSEYGIVLTKREWTINGDLVYEKAEPTEDDLKMRDIQREWYMKVTNE